MDQLLALRTFVRIAEAGSFAKAAGSLDLPRSSVSKLLQDLERHVGARLISRNTRAIAVTPEGERYYELATRLLADLDEMDASLGGAGGRPSGRLRVDVGSSLANLILIPALPAFRARYPDIELVLGISDRSVDLIGDGVDCVIRGGALADSSLIARRLGDLEYVTCAAPRYFDGHPQPLLPAELAADHFALSYFSASSGNSFPLRFERDAERIELFPKSVVSVNESTAHMTALLAGLGIGQTFEFVARPYLDEGRLVEVLRDWRPAPHPLHVVYPSNRHPGAKLRAFVEWAIEIFGAIPNTEDFETAPQP